MQNFLAGSCGSFSTGSNKFHYSISVIPWLSVLTLQETVSFQRVRYGFKPTCVEGGGRSQRDRKSYMCIIRILPTKRWHLKPIRQVGQTGFNRDGLRFSMRFLTKPSTSHCRFAHGLRSLPAGRAPPLQQQDRWPEFPPATHSTWYEKETLSSILIAATRHSQALGRKGNLPPEGSTAPAGLLDAFCGENPQFKHALQ